LKERGYEFIIGKEKARIPDDISTYKYNSLAIKNIITKNVSGLNFQERIKNVLRTIKYNLNPHVFTNISNPVFLIGYRSQQEVVSYCNQNKISPICLPTLLFVNNRYEKVNKDSKLNEVLEFVYSFIVLIEKQFPEINSSLFELLRKELVECFIYSLLLFRQNVNVFRKFKPKKLLATGLGLPIHREFCASWRYAGGDVVGFVHGNNYFRDCSPVDIHFLTLVNHYVTTSAGHKDILQNTAKDCSFGLRIGSIAFTKSSYNKRLFTEIQRKKPVNKIKRIMLVGFPMAGYYYYLLPAGYAHTQLNLELRLVKILRSRGYYVIYKPHPMTINLVEGIFERYVDKVLNERFEEVYDTADCIIFGNFATTTFGYALLTNKPIVLIEVKGNYWYPRALELIKKRCTVVEAEIVDGTIVYDEKDVLNAINNSLENINYDILYEFAF
jgi:hypothetical protein